jgi:hypothetical protein
MMAAHPILWIIVGLLFIGLGAYMRTAPRRLFTRPDDPSEYRPQATELESDQGRWLTRTYPRLLILFGLALVVIQIISLLSE